PLDVRGRTQRGDRQRLRLTTGEQAGAMRARDEPDLDRDGPDVGEAASVDPDPLVEDEPADGLLLEEAEQALADAGGAARLLEERVCVPAGPVGANGVRDALAQRGDATWQIVREPQQE